MSIAEAVAISNASAKKETNTAEDALLPPVVKVVRLVMSGK
jgi:hypothetical protein